MKIQFSGDLEFQQQAIRSVIDLFNGMDREREPGAEWMSQIDLAPNLPPGEELFESTLQNNLYQVQYRNGIRQSHHLQVEQGADLKDELRRFPQFNIEMETGTGKTYVYLRTMRELHQQFGFSKFVVVVPSVAIYQGVLKSFDMTRAHFESEYGNMYARAYDGDKPAICKDFATSGAPEVLVMTLQAFARLSNNFYKPTDKLVGSDLLPYQYVQQTRPIVILDEPQNMESDGAKRAIRTLNPLFVLRYSATHRSHHNLLYKLTPFEAFRNGLVKRIEVLGITENDNYNQAWLELLEVRAERGSKPVAMVRTQYRRPDGSTELKDLTIKMGDHLYKLTNGQEEYAEGFKVADIVATPGEEGVEFENGQWVWLRQTVGVSRKAVFRAQIREAVKRHFARQNALRAQGIKVLTLFFIDRVANFTDPENGLIRQLFDEEYQRLAGSDAYFKKYPAAAVREAYFASFKKKIKGSTVETEFFVEDEETSDKDSLEAQKRSFELIMKNKELLLTLPDQSPDPKAQVAFIFAHSALKEGWDNPNVFQICTLNQTKSDRKKRQEIGRGLRIAVNQSGERVLDESVNILTVIANESYESYVNGLQKNYADDDRLAAGERPPAPSNASKGQVFRNEAVFGMPEFREFWDKLAQRVQYNLKFDEARFIQDAVARLNHVKFPLPKIITQRGDFVQSQLTIKLLEVAEMGRVRLRIEVASTHNKDVEAVELTLDQHEDLADRIYSEHLKGEKFILHEIHRDRYVDNSYLRFRNGLEVSIGQPLSFRSFGGQRMVTGTPNFKIEEQYPVFDLISRAARETKLTKRTVSTIFSKISQDQVKDCLLNPEGFTEKFVDELKKLVAHHIASSLEFEVSGKEALDLAHYFPEKPSFVQYRLEDAGQNSVYDRVQIDSEVENRFMSNRLRDQREVIFYFKFPRSYKIALPKMIHDYNPDWGVLYEDPDGKRTIELIRETKGSTDKDSLRFHSEGLKITCAEKYYDLLQIDYRVVTDEIPEWWQKEHRAKYATMDWNLSLQKAAEEKLE